MIQEPVLLFLNAGRRVELIRNVRAAFQLLGFGGRIVTTDINKLAPGLYLGDSQHVLPPCSDSRFLGKFLDICLKERVSLVIPLIDPDLAILSDHREMINATGARVLVSNAEAIQICGDKFETTKFLEANGFITPRIFDLKEARRHGCPLFIKPADGSASINSYKVNTDEELKFFAHYVPNAMIQEFVEGEEFTVDVFSDWTGEPLAAVPRRRLKVRAGEVSVGKVEKRSALESLAKEVAKVLGTVGPINVQAITSDQAIYIIEINPRFGGGCPLSMAAGLPLAKWVSQMALDQPIERDQFVVDDGLSMLRFDDSMFLHVDDSPR